MAVSVCVPTHNSSQYIRACLDSVLGQTYGDFELVVSDDASIDNTCEIVRSYVDRRIRLLRLDRPMGMAFNFNHAAAQARGKFVKILCHDDLIDPDCLQKQVSMLEDHPSLSMVTSALRYVDGGGRELRLSEWSPRRTIFSTADAVAGAIVHGNVLGPPSATLIRRQYLLKAGPFSEDFPLLMDMHLWFRLMALGPVGYLREPLSSFRLHPEATTEKLRSAGVIRKDVMRMTEAMLGLVHSSPMVRRVAWGRAAGSFLKQAVAGMRSGHFRWPLEAIWQAIRIDPALAGLALFLLLFRTGVLGIEVTHGTELRVCRGRDVRERI